MNRVYIIIFLLLSFVIPTNANQNVNSILNKAISLVSNNGVSATYTISINKISQTGIFKMQNSSFVIENPEISTWYDGKTQWNYNSEQNEVTISIPTSEELEQINPYYILKSYKKNYNATLSKSKLKGTYSVILTPKTKSNSIKKVVLYIKASDSKLVRADITNENNSLITLILTNFKTGQKFASSTFKFQKNKFNNLKIIDLR